MTALLLSAYVLTVYSAYERVHARFADWEARAEIAAITIGLVLWLSLAVLVVEHM